MSLYYVSGTVLGPGENDTEQHDDLPFLPVAEQDVYIEGLSSPTDCPSSNPG